MPDGGEITTVLRKLTFTHVNGTSETDLVEHLSLTELIDHHLDFSNLNAVNLTTIRAFEKIDGINYRKIGERVFPTDYEPGQTGIIVVLDGAGQDMKITLQSSISEGSNKTIPATTRDTVRT